MLQRRIFSEVHIYNFSATYVKQTSLKVKSYLSALSLEAGIELNAGVAKTRPHYHTIDLPTAGKCHTIDACG